MAPTTEPHLTSSPSFPSRRGARWRPLLPWRALAHASRRPDAQRPAVGDGAPVVTFLHGAGLNAHRGTRRSWRSGLPRPRDRPAGTRRLLVADDVDYSPATLAPDVAAGHRGWTDAPQLLVGQSLGGLTAAAVAASRPELVARLVVIDITPGIDPYGGSSQLREFFAGPTDWASRDELVERALAFGLGGSRRADRARRVLQFPGAAGRPRRVEAPLRAPGGAALAPHPPRTARGRARHRSLARPSASRVGGSRRRHRARSRSSAAIRATSPRRMPRNSRGGCPRLVTTLPPGTTCRSTSPPNSPALIRDAVAAAGNVLMRRRSP